MDRLVLVATIVVVVTLAWWLSGRPARAIRRRARRAARGEDRAERLLARAGYSIEARQVVRRWPMVVDGDAVEATLRADLIVRRRRRRYVAEVKTGSVATNPTDPATRRQLLEYRLAFDVDGVLLIDMERRRILPIEFPRLRR